MSPPPKLRALSAHERFLARAAVDSGLLTSARIKQHLRGDDGRHWLLALLESGELTRAQGEALLQVAQELLAVGGLRIAAEREDRALAEQLREEGFDEDDLQQGLIDQTRELEDGSYHSLGERLVAAGALRLERYLELIGELSASELIRCPHCAEPYRVATERLGRRLRCKQCRQPFVASAMQASRTSQVVSEIQDVADDDGDDGDSPYDDESIRASDFRNSSGDYSELEASSAANPPVTRRLVPRIEDSEALADYEIEREIARGGMGIVYRARQRSLDRWVALKVLKNADTASRASLKRFLREAQAAAKLNHPNIVSVYEVRLDVDVPYFAMDYVEGQPLDKLLASGELGRREGVEMLACVADALECAHRHGIIHRDVKPANIIVDRDGVPLVTDFGLAKAIADNTRLTRSGHPIGTPHYMSPEQARGDRAAMLEPSDVYSTGVILYELLTGRVPFVGRSNNNVYAKIFSEQPKPPSDLDPSVDGDLDLIVLKTLAKQPQDRYLSAAELAADLRRWLDGKPVNARGRRRRASASAAPSPALLAAGALLLALVGVAIAFMLPRGPGESGPVASSASSSQASVSPVASATSASASPALAIAQIALEAGDLEGAVVACERRLAEDPSDPRALLLRGKARYFLGNHTSSRADLRRGLGATRDPGLQAELQLWLGANQLADDDADGARQTLTGVVAARPEDAEAQLYLAAACYRLGRAFEALRACRQASELDPRSAAARRSLCWLYLESADHERLNKSARALLADRPWEIGPRLMLAVSLAKLLRHEEAAEALQAIEATRPVRPVMMPSARLMELFEGGPDLALGQSWPVKFDIRDLGQPGALGLKALSDMLNRAATYMAVGGYSGQTFISPADQQQILARHLMPAMMRAQPADRPLLIELLQRARYSFAVSQLGNRDLRGALLSTTMLLRENPDLIGARMLRCRLAVRAKQAELALDDTKQLLDRGQRNATVLTLRARALALAGHDDLVEDALEQAIELEPRRYDTHLVLGDFLRASSDAERADRCYRRAAAIEPLLRAADPHVRRAHRAKDD